MPRHDRPRWGVALLAVCLGSGCDDGREGVGPRDPEPDAAATDSATPSPSAATEPRAAEPRPNAGSPGDREPPPPGFDLPLVLDGLPALDMTVRERVYIDLSRRLEKRGLKAMRADDFAGATERFFEALEVDPGNVGARYNLACSLSREGEARAAVTLLEQLRDGGCGWCLGKVLKARRDTDFDPIRKTKAFAAVVADVEVGLSEVGDAAMAVVAWSSAGKEAEAPTVVDPRRKVTVRVGCPTCEASKAEVTTVRGARALRTWVERKRKAFSGGIADPILGECKSKCCSFAEPDPRRVSPDVLFLAEVCFRIESGFATSLSKVSLSRYPAPGVAPQAGTGGG
ncbi:MAG: hypothetical protein AAF721_31870 [Myxococcota bacterium]